MNAETFKNVADGVQSIIFALGIIIGGGWTIFTFMSTRAARKAKAELLALEQGLRREPTLEVGLAARPLDPLHPEGPTVVICTLKNAGLIPVGVDMPEPWLVAHSDVGRRKARTKVEAFDQEVVQADGSTEVVEQRILRPSQVRDVPLLLRPSPSPRLVQFSATYYGVELADGDVIETADTKIIAFAQLWVPGT